MTEEHGFSRRMMPADGSVLLPVLRRIARIALFGIMTVGGAGFLPGLGSHASHTAAVSSGSASTSVSRSGREQAEGGSTTFHADSRGHFLIDADVNGHPVRFLLDTGATDVVIGSKTARDLGIDPDTLDYTQQFQTANGVAAGAPVTLREIRIGSLSVYDVRATVMRGPMPVALLGNTFLDRLSGHKVRDGVLTLYW